MSQLFRIWSNEHQAWWRPGAWGYTREVGEAGWFTPDETLRYLYGSACGALPGKPNAVAVDGSGLRFVLELQREDGGDA